MTGENYVVISADCHGGADVAEYRPYLESRHHDDFDAWLATFENPFDDVVGDAAGRNWDSDRRRAELEADGVVAEVVFPNTIPPFFPKVSLVHQPPGAGSGDLERRWAGLRAHNRWLADFCAATPGRRAGIGQIMLHDVEGAVAEIHWLAEHGLTGGVLLPGAPPGSGVPPLYAPDYEPIWRACEELGLPVNHHSGSAVPDMGDYPAAQAVFLLEVTWWAHRTLWHLPLLRSDGPPPGAAVRVHRAGYGVGARRAGAPRLLLRPTRGHRRCSRLAGSQVRRVPRRPHHAAVAGLGAPVPAGFELHPTPRGRRCATASGPTASCGAATSPTSKDAGRTPRDHLRLAFAGVPEPDVRAMVGANAARVYGFDLDALAPLAASFGPSPAEIAEPLPPDQIPDAALRCPTFAAARMLPA